MDNKATILKCALDLFYAKGYDGAGVQEIADAAGITKPTLYHYFGSKKGLLEQILAVHYAILEEQIDQVIQQKRQVPGMLYEIARAFFDFGFQNRKSYLLMLALFYSGRESEGFNAIYPLIQRFYNKIVGVFDNAADELGNMNGREKDFAIGFIGILDHHLMLMNQNLGDDEVTAISNEQTYRIVHQFMYGIYS